MELVRGSREHVWAWAHVCGTVGRCIYTHVHICDSACDHVDVCTAGCARGHTGTHVCRAVCLCNHTTTQCARVCPQTWLCEHMHTHVPAPVCKHIWQSPMCMCVGGRAWACRGSGAALPAPFQQLKLPNPLFFPPRELHSQRLPTGTQLPQPHHAPQVQEQDECSDPRAGSAPPSSPVPCV